ncbi:hypothetical protein EON80_01805 [bacterium]|nr:MAG: hypothetical protein EON80_01805 [bacterium]
MRVLISSKTISRSSKVIWNKASKLLVAATCGLL